MRRKSSILAQAEEMPVSGVHIGVRLMLRDGELPGRLEIRPDAEGQEEIASS